MTVRSNLLALLCLLLVGVISHHQSLFAPEALIDEAFYEAGMEALSTSGSAYDAPGFLYPPSFAAGGLWLRTTLGVETLRYGIRWINFLGVLFILWFTLHLYHGGPTANGLTSETVRSTPAANRDPKKFWLVVLCLVLMNAPGVRLGLYVGNVSFLVGALIIWCLWWAERKPIAAGAGLGLSLLIKPLVAGALPLLLVRSAPTSLLTGSTARNRYLAAAVACSSSLSVLWFFRSELHLMLEAELTNIAQDRAISVYRVARLFDLPENRLLIFGTIVGLASAYLWNRFASPMRLLVAGLTLIPMTTLAVWPHTMVLFFPVCGLAARRLMNRRGQATAQGNMRLLRRTSAPKHQLETVLIIGGLAVVYFSQGGGYAQIAAPLQVLLLAVPLATPPALALYWLRTNPVA